MPFSYNLNPSYYHSPKEQELYKSWLTKILAKHPEVAEFFANIAETNLHNNPIKYETPTADYIPSVQRTAHSVPYTVPRPEHNQFTIVLDLDQTLLQAVYNNGVTITYPRPFATAFLNLLSTITDKQTDQKAFRIILWSAGVKYHVESCLDKVDPSGIIQHIIYRDHHSSRLVNINGETSTIPNWCYNKSLQFDNKKILAWLPGCAGKVILFDDNHLTGSMPANREYTTFTEFDNPVITIPAYTGTLTSDCALICGLLLMLFIHDRKPEQLHTYDLIKYSIEGNARNTHDLAFFASPGFDPSPVTKLNGRIMNLLLHQLAQYSLAAHRKKMAPSRCPAETATAAESIEPAPSVLASAAEPILAATNSVSTPQTLLLPVTSVGSSFAAGASDDDRDIKLTPVTPVSFSGSLASLNSSDKISNLSFESVSSASSKSPTCISTPFSSALTQLRQFMSAKLAGNGDGAARVFKSTTYDSFTRIR